MTILSCDVCRWRGYNACQCGVERSPEPTTSYRLERERKEFLASQGVVSQPSPEVPADVAASKDAEIAKLKTKAQWLKAANLEFQQQAERLTQLQDQIVDEMPDAFGRMGIVAGIKEWCRQWKAVLDHLHNESQLACDLRCSQDQIIERCAQSVSEKFPEAAAIIRSHADGISGEDWGELTRENKALREQVEKLTAELAAMEGALRNAKELLMARAEQGFEKWRDCVDEIDRLLAALEGK